MSLTDRDIAATPGEQWIGRAGGAAVILVITGAATVTEWNAVPPLALWRILSADLAALAAAAAALNGAVSRGGPRWGPVLLSVATLALGTSAIPLLFGQAGLVWVPYIGLVALARSALPIRWLAPLTVVPLTTIAVQTWLSSHSPGLLALTLGAAVAAVAWIIWRIRRREAAELAAAQEEVIEQERASVRAAERRREVAAQVHDVLAHTLSGLIVTLQTTTVRAGHEGGSPELMDLLNTATDLAKDGLAGARRAVATLDRDPDRFSPDSRPESRPDSRPESWLDWHARTIQPMVTGAGVQVDVGGDPELVPAAWIELARSTVQEGLTNSIRHAVGAPIRLTYAAGGVAVTSVGDPASFVDRGHPGSGRGLTGLAGRAGVEGGSVRWGAEPAGFVLRLTWPDRS